MSADRRRCDCPPEVIVESGAAAALDLLGADRPVDLREHVPAQLRTSRGAAPAPAVGCPCGCGEAELVALARGGDDAAMNELLTRYRAMARAKARSYFLIGAERDDVVQEGMIGVYKAIRDFDAGRGVPFGAFAEMCVTRQVITAVKGARRNKHAPLSDSVSIDRPLRAGDEASLTLADVLPAPDETDPEALAISGDELRALQRHFGEVLSDLESQVLRHHIEGKTYDEIAGMLQRHVKSVDNALQRIRRKLQSHLDARRSPAGS